MRLWLLPWALFSLALALVKDLQVYDSTSTQFTLLVNNALVTFNAVQLVAGADRQFWTTGLSKISSMFIITVPPSAAVILQVEGDPPCTTDGDFQVTDFITPLGSSMCMNGVSVFTYAFATSLAETLKYIYMTTDISTYPLSGFILALNAVTITLDDTPYAWTAPTGGYSDFFQFTVPIGNSVQVTSTSTALCTSVSAHVPFTVFQDFELLAPPICESVGEPFMFTQVFSATTVPVTVIIKMGNDAAPPGTVTGSISARLFDEPDNYGLVFDWDATPGTTSATSVAFTVAVSAQAIVQARDFNPCSVAGRFAILSGVSPVATSSCAGTFSYATSIFPSPGPYTVAVRNDSMDNLYGTIQVSHLETVALNEAGTVWTANRAQYSFVYNVYAGLSVMRLFVQASTVAPCVVGSEEQFIIYNNFDVFGTSSCASSGTMSTFAVEVAATGNQYFKMYNNTDDTDLTGALEFFTAQNLLIDGVDVAISATAGNNSNMFIFTASSVVPVYVQVLIPGSCSAGDFTAFSNFATLDSSYCDPSNTYSLLLHAFSTVTAGVTNFNILNNSGTPMVGLIDAFTNPTVVVTANWQGFTVRPFAFSTLFQLTIGPNELIALQIAGGASCNPFASAFLVYESGTQIGSSSCMSGTNYFTKTYSAPQTVTLRLYNTAPTIFAGQIRAVEGTIPLTINGPALPLFLAPTTTSYAYSLTIPAVEGVVLSVLSSGCTPGSPAFTVFVNGASIGSSTCTEAGTMSGLIHGFVTTSTTVTEMITVRNNSAIAALLGTIGAATAPVIPDNGVPIPVIIPPGGQSPSAIVQVFPGQPVQYVATAGSECVDGVPAFAVFNGELLLGFSTCAPVPETRSLGPMRSFMNLFKVFTSRKVLATTNYFEVTLATPGTYVMIIQNLGGLPLIGDFVLSPVSVSTSTITATSTSSTSTNTTATTDTTATTSTTATTATTATTSTTNTTNTTATTATTNTTSTTSTRSTTSTESFPTTVLPLSTPPVWTIFEYGAAGSTVPEVFAFAQTTPVVLEVQDFICSGNRFAIYDNGVFIGNSTYALNDGCATFAPTVESAVGNLYYSSFTRLMPPGLHQITIHVLVSVLGHGSAGIRIRAPLDVCATQLSGMTVVKTPKPFASAEATCQSIGQSLANITTYNFDDATRLVFGCVGAFSKAFVRSYWANTYQDSCLALYTGSAAPGGSLSVPASCTDPLPLICQA